MSSVPYFILDVSTAGVAAQTVFNGVTLSDENGRSVRRGLKLNGWAILGENRIVVRLRALGEAQAPPRFSLTLRESISETDGDRTLLEYTWDPSMRLAGLAAIEVFARTVQLAPVRAWTWTTASRIPELSVTDKSAIAGLLVKLHDALAARNIEDVAAMQSQQISEQSLALGMDSDAALNRYREFLSDRMAQPDWTVRPFQARELRIQSMAEGRVHHVTDPAGQPAISASSAGRVFAIDPFVAKIASQWTIVR